MFLCLKYTPEDFTGAIPGGRSKGVQDRER
jgi:hypothetical protein